MKFQKNLNNDYFSSSLSTTNLLPSLYFNIFPSSCLTHISPLFPFMTSESFYSSLSHSLYPKVPFDLLGSMVTPSYILTSKDLVLRIKDEGKDVAFVFLDLGNSTQHNIFQIHHLPADFIFFTAEEYSIVYMNHIFIIY